MSNVLRVLGHAAGVAGAGYQGYGVDKQLAVKDLLAQNEAKRQADNDAVANALRDSQRLENDARAKSLLNPKRAVRFAPNGDAFVEAGQRIIKNPDGSFSVRDDDAPTVAAAPKAPIAPPAFKEFGADLAKPQGATDALSIGGPAPQAPAQAPAPKPPSSVASLVRPQAPAVVPDKPLNFAKPPVERAKTYANYTDPKGGVHLATGEEAKQNGWIQQRSDGGGTRGFGQGGVFGAGSGIGSVNEMKAANPNLKTYEKQFIGNLPTASLTAVDRFRQRLADDIKVNGFISAAKATEAERELAAYNPDLVVYGRNLAQWVISDLNLSRGSTDERQRLDFHVSGLSTPLSSMPPAQREVFLTQMWEARDGRLDGLSRAAAAATKMLGKISGEAGATDGGGKTATSSAGKPSISSAEAAALKTQGFTDAQINARYTVTP